jgi:hypothetical protein
MPAHTITAVSPNVREWTSQKGGPMKSYRVHLKAQDGTVTENVEWARKADSPAPTVDQQIDCTIDPRPGNDYGPKLALEQKGGFGGGGGGWKPKPPEERRSIAMQHAQKCAVTLLELAAQHGEYKPAKAGDAVEQLKAISWVLFRQVIEAETKDRPDA